MAEKCRNLSRFSKGLLIYTAALLLIALSALAVLYAFLGAYEASRSQTFIKEYLAAASVELPDECEALIDSLDAEIKSKDDNRDVLLAMHEDASYSKLLSQSSAEETAYALSYQGKAFATIRIAQTGRSSFGMARWELQSAEYELSPFIKKLSISLPEDYSLYLNGNLLSKKYITDKKAPYELLTECYEDFDTLPYLTSYESGPYLGELEIKALSPDGEALGAEMLTEVQFLNNCSAAEKEKLEPFIAELLDRYLTFAADLYSNSSYNYSRLRQLVVPESHLHQRMRLAFTSFGFSDVESCRILSSNISVISRLPDGHYFVDVDYVSEVVAKAGPVETEARVRILLVEDDDDFLAEALYHY